MRRLLIYPVALYLCACAAGCFFSDKIIFPCPRSSYEDDERIFKLTMADGVKLSATYLPNDAPAYTILYNHGNGEDIGEMRRIFETIRSTGVDVLAYDYRGYGTSEGRPSESRVLADVDVIYDHLTQTLDVAPERVIVYGRSMGGGPAVDLAMRKPVAGLILEGAFTSAYRVVTRWPLLPGDKLVNISKIDKVSCPVLVIHGTNDWIVANWHGRKLFDRANEPKMSLWVEGAGHNNLVRAAGDSYTDALKSFYELVDQTARDRALSE